MYHIDKGQRNFKLLLKCPKITKSKLLQLFKKKIDL